MKIWTEVNELEHNGEVLGSSKGIRKSNFWWNQQRAKERKHWLSVLRMNKITSLQLYRNKNDKKKIL